MIDEFLKIRHGECGEGKTPLIKDLYLQFASGQLHLVLCSVKAVQDAVCGLLCGRLHLSGGSCTLHGVHCDPRQFAESIARESAAVGSTSKLISALDLSENLFLSHIKGFPLIRNKQVNAARQLLERFQLDLRPFVKIKNLTLVERIQVELLKAYAEGRRLIVIDYVISFLTDQERKAVCSLIEKMCQEGYTFVVIANYEIELLELADTVTLVIHDRTQYVFPKGALDQKILSRTLVGHMEHHTFGMQSSTSLPAVFSAKHLCGDSLRDISFSICAGETLQIIYTHSSEAEELFDLLCGRRQKRGGCMYLDRRPYAPRRLADAVRQGAAFISALPVQDQLFMGLSLFDNLCLPKASLRNWRFWLDPRYKKSLQQFCQEQFQELPASLSELPPEALTKLLYLKWLIYRPKLLVCLHPFIGEDISARVAAEEMIRTLSKHGIALLLLSPNSTTVRLYRGRVLLLSDGRLNESRHIEP